MIWNARGGSRITAQFRSRLRWITQGETFVRNRKDCAVVQLSPRNLASGCRPFKSFAALPDSASAHDVGRLRGWAQSKRRASSS